MGGQKTGRINRKGQEDTEGSVGKAGGRAKGKTRVLKLVICSDFDCGYDSLKLHVDNYRFTPASHPLIHNVHLTTWS